MATVKLTIYSGSAEEGRDVSSWEDEGNLGWNGKCTGSWTVRKWGEGRPDEENHLSKGTRVGKQRVCLGNDEKSTWLSCKGNGEIKWKGKL